MIDKQREGKELFENMDMAVYSDTHFSMFAGTIGNVTLRCKNEFSNVVIDRFGPDIAIIKADNESFTVNVKVAMSKQFLGWVFGLGGGVKIIAPSDLN